MKPDHDPIIDSLRRHLDMEVENLDAATRNRLRDMRRSAVNASRASAGRSHFSGFPGLGMPARIAVATGVVLLGLLFAFQEPDGKNRMATHDIETIDGLVLLASTHDMEFYRNLEFISWYAQTQHGQ